MCHVPDIWADKLEQGHKISASYLTAVACRFIISASMTSAGPLARRTALTSVGVSVLGRLTLALALLLGILLLNLRGLLSLSHPAAG